MPEAPADGRPIVKSLRWSRALVLRGGLATVLLLASCIPPAVALETGDVAERLRRGNEAYGREAWAEALGQYAQAPENVDCKLGLGLCLVKLGNLNAARPLLLDAYTIYPTDVNLLAALRIVNEAEIRDLVAELQDLRPDDKRAPSKRARLATLYELNGHSLKAAQLLLLMTPSSQMSFDELLRVAGLLHSGGAYAQAGQIYEKAAILSPNPRLTTLAAVDCYLARASLGRAERLLDKLAVQKPGSDLDFRYAIIYARSGRFKKARVLYAGFGRGAETNAGAARNPREAKLYAADCYLNAGMYDEASRLLEEIVQQASGYDVDSRLARMFFEQGRFSKAEEIYAKYPDDLAMQTSRGWALVRLGCWKSARLAFQGVLRKDPHNSSARAGYDHTVHHTPCDLFLVGTSMDYGNYRDPRRLKTQIFRYVDRRAVTTLSHTRTDTHAPSPDTVPFKEELYGLKVYYQLDPKNALQLHFMTFQNNDPTTDDGSVVGGRYLQFTDRWTFGFEGSTSKYPAARAYQACLIAGCRPSRYLRLDARGTIIRQDVAGTTARPTTRCAKGILSWWPHERFLVALSGWVGSRQLAVDVDGMYAYNVLDVYLGGFSISGLVKVAHPLKLFASYAYSPFTAEWTDAGARDAPGRMFNSEHLATILSVGLDYLF